MIQTAGGSRLGAIVDVHCVIALVLIAGCATGGGKRDPAGGVSGIEMYRARVSARPDDVDARYQLANAFFDAGRYEEAALSYNELLRIEPHHVGALCNGGLCYRVLGDAVRSLRMYEKALSIDPDDITTLQNITIALHRSGRHADDVIYLSRLAELLPDDVQIASDLGDEWQALRRYEEAEHAYQNLVELDPGYADAHYRLGLSRHSQGYWKGARDAWQTVIVLDPTHRDAHRSLAVVHWRLKDYDRAWASVAECQRLGAALDPEFIRNLQNDSGRVGPGSESES